MIIYKATNLTNCKVYIGKTKFSLEKRTREHFRDSKCKKYKSIFHNSLLKYGLENFTWEVLTETDSDSKLSALEKFYIACYRKMGEVYNMTDGGDGLSPGYKASDETKMRMSKSRKGKPSHRKGKTLSISTRLKMSKSQIDNKNHTGKLASEETKKKLSLILIGNTRSVGKLKGEKNPMFGKTHSTEARKKISATSKGRLHSEESRKKISESSKKYWSEKRLKNENL